MMHFGNGDKLNNGTLYTNGSTRSRFVTNIQNCIKIIMLGQLKVATFGH